MSDSDSQYGRGRNMDGSRHKSEQVPVGYTLEANHISLKLSGEMYTVTDIVIIISIATIVQVHQDMSKKKFTGLTNVSLPR